MAQQLTGGVSGGSDGLGGGLGVASGGVASWTGRDMLIGAAIVLGGAALALIPAFAADALGFSTALAVFLAAMIAGGGMLCAVRVAGLSRRRLSWRAVGWRLPADARHWWLALAALLGSLSFTAVYALAAEALGIGFLVPERLPADLLGDGWTALALAFAVIIWTPVAEETFFRGFLFPGLSAKIGLWGGIAVSSAIFALSHMSIGTIIPITVTGALFAWVFHKSGSLLPPILAHASQNMLAFLAAFFA